MIRSTKVLAAVVVAGLALAGCGTGGNASGKATPGGGNSDISAHVPLAKQFDPAAEFSWAYTVEATSLDPQRGSSGFDQNWLLPVYDRLVYSSPDGTLEPMLAKSWTAGANGKSLTFKLRTGVKFSDGTAFNADAVKSSLDRARGDQSTIKTELANILDVHVVDPSTVTLKLTGGAGALLGALTDRAGMIVSPQAAKAGTLDTTPVGVGPYEVVENKPGDRVVYKKTADYWNPKAQNVETMVYRVMSDDQTRLNALKSGELTMALIRQNQVQPALNMGLKILSGQSPTFYLFNLNTSMKPFDNPKVRQALSLAIDRKGIGDGLLEGFCTPQIQPWPKTSYAYDKKLGDGLDKVPYDTDKAKKLLKEAGLGNGFAFDLSITSITGYTAVAEAVQAQLKKIGVTVNLKVLPSVQAAQEFQIDKTVAANITGNAPTADPQGVLDRLLLPTAAANPGKYTDPVVVDLAQKAADAIDTKERAGYYHQIMAEMVKTTPNAVPICMQQRTEAYAPTVSGLNIYASGARDYRGVAVSKEK